MKIHRQLTAAAFLFISMAIMAQVPFSKKEVKEKMKQGAGIPQLSTSGFVVG